MATFADLRAANAARQREWDPGGRLDLAYRGNEMAGEVGEACNVIKKLECERRGIPGSRATVAELAEELADVVICADLIAMAEGIDLLGQAVPAKFNATSTKVGLATRLADPGDLGPSAYLNALAEEGTKDDVLAALERCMAKAAESALRPMYAAKAETWVLAAYAGPTVGDEPPWITARVVRKADGDPAFVVDNLGNTWRMEDFLGFVLLPKHPGTA